MQIEPELKDFLDELLHNLTRKDEIIETLQKDVLYMDRKMNERTPRKMAL